MTVANFIIGGTEKAGTTSVFSYLSAHPEVTASRRKETDFFRRPDGTLDEYEQFFPERANTRVVMEASPGYLGEADTVVPRLEALLPEVRLLFILRDPVERFHSSFQFHKAKLNLPAEMDPGEYLDACQRYVEDVPVPAEQVPLDEWFLKVLPFGCYAPLLDRYYRAFGRERVAVMFYDDLRDDPRAFMERLSGFLGIDAGFWSGADLAPRNVTFSGRSRWLHRLAVWVNDTLEPVLRPRPALKQTVVTVYKRLNAAREGYEDMPADVRERLVRFYAPHNRELARLLGRPLPQNWSGEDPPAGQPAARDGRAVAEPWRQPRGRAASS